MSCISAVPLFRSTFVPRELLPFPLYLGCFRHGRAHARPGEGRWIDSSLSREMRRPSVLISRVHW